MNILVCYDVNTETAQGRKRLRKVAECCQDFGQRVQLSLFECKVTDVQMEHLRARLLDLIDSGKDSLRIYRLHGSRETFVESYGLDTYEDFDNPLVL